MAFPLCLYQVQFHNNLRCKSWDMINIRKDSSSSYLNVDFTSYNVECMTAVMLISLKKKYLHIDLMSTEKLTDVNFTLKKYLFHIKRQPQI